MARKRTASSSTLQADPTYGSKLRRLEGKSLRSTTKALRAQRGSE